MSESLKKLIESILGTLRVAAGLTETTIDDSAVNVLETILKSDALLSWLGFKLMASGDAHWVEDLPASVLDELADAGHDQDCIEGFCETVLPAVRGVVRPLV